MLSTQKLEKKVLRAKNRCEKCEKETRNGKSGSDDTPSIMKIRCENNAETRKLKRVAHVMYAG